jgi:hypothetical protein
VCSSDLAPLGLVVLRQVGPIQVDKPTRLGELCRLRWRDLSTANRALLVHKTKGDATPHWISIDEATV